MSAGRRFRALMPQPHYNSFANVVPLWAFGLNYEAAFRQPAPDEDPASSLP